MLRKRLGIEGIERDWIYNRNKSEHYFKTPSTLIIPENVERIGRAAFCGCEGLKKVVIPESVKEIMDYAFWDCLRATIILKKPVIEFKFIGYCALDCVKDVKKEVRS